MAALAGFETFTATHTLSGALALGNLICPITVPEGYVVGGLDLEATDLDTNAAPTIMLTVGDPADTDRLLAANNVGQAGGTVEDRPANTAWYRYAAATVVSVRVSTGPATGATSGTVTLTLYTYPATTRADAQAMVLHELGVLPEGQAARAADALQAAIALQEQHDENTVLGLGAREDLEWPITYIPRWAVRRVVCQAAYRLAGVYGATGPRLQRLATNAVQGERELRRQVRKATAGCRVVATFY